MTLHKHLNAQEALFVDFWMLISLKHVTFESCQIDTDSIKESTITIDAFPILLSRWLLAPQPNEGGSFLPTKELQGLLIKNELEI